jgi:hypothetical protein
MPAEGWRRHSARAGPPGDRNSACRAAVRASASGTSGIPAANPGHSTSSSCSHEFSRHHLPTEGLAAHVQLTAAACPALTPSLDAELARRPSMIDRIYRAAGAKSVKHNDPFSARPTRPRRQGSWAVSACGAIRLALCAGKGRTRPSANRRRPRHTHALTISRSWRCPSRCLP